MRISVLGPVKVVSADGTPVDISGVRLRMLLARLALDAGRPVSVASLIDGLWGEEPPAGATGALHTLVSRLRKALGEAGTIDFVAGGYVLLARDEDVDAHRFEALTRQGGRDLAAGKPEAAASTLGAALRLWRGEALADVLEAPFARGYATRLDDLRTAAAEDRFDAELQLARYAEVLSDLEAAGAQHPLSERLAGLRMRALSAAGRQSDALAVYEEMRATLGEELGIDPSPELREIHLALLRGELERPRARPEPVTSRLPGRLTSFVGRDAELDGLAELLAASRLVTIVGPGGAGKTRLSLEAADRVHGRVWFVPLAGVGASDQLVDAVAGVLNPQKAGPITELLDVGEALLVLDNCEHLIAAVAELADQLLDRLSQLRILTTSREPLAITGEALCHLGPLVVPVGTPEPAEAAESSAVRLFVDRAADVRTGFALDEHSVGPVVEICRKLDGIPLALELAAAKLRSMSVEQIALRLDDRFRLLTSGSRTALPRQRTLLAMVEWSWDLLEEPERVLARRLSMFPGGATVDALESICSDASLPAEDVLYVLGSLVEKSIVEQPRYRMLETIRAYAAARFAESGDSLSTRFADHFLDLAEQHEPLLRTGEQLKAIAVFDAEHENMVSALRAAVEARDAALVSRFVRALFWYWGIRGMSTQFETYLAEVLTFELPDETRAAFRVIQQMAGAPDADAKLITESVDFHPAMHLAIPLLAFATGDTALGERRLQQSLESPDPWVRASAHWSRHVAFTERGDQRAGAHARLEALRGFEAVGDRWGLGMTLLAVGGDHSLRGEYGEAIAAFERAVAIGSELGMEDDILQSRARLALERMRSGDLAGAARDIEAAQRLAKKMGFSRMAAVLLISLAELHRRSGDLKQADEALDQLDKRVRRRPVLEEWTRDQIARARMANRLAEGAAGSARELSPLAVHGDAEDLAKAAELLARLLLLEDDPAGAAAALGMSQVIRGVFDEGEPELRGLREELIGRLGEERFREAYSQGAESRAQALLRFL